MQPWWDPTPNRLVRRSRKGCAEKPTLLGFLAMSMGTPGDTPDHQANNFLVALPLFGLCLPVLHRLLHCRVPDGRCVGLALGEGVAVDLSSNIDARMPSSLLTMGRGTPSASSWLP